MGRGSKRSLRCPQTKPPPAVPSVKSVYAKDMSARSHPNSASSGFMKVPTVVIVPKPHIINTVAAITTLICWRELWMVALS